MGDSLLNGVKHDICLPGWARVLRPVRRGDIVWLWVATPEDLATAAMFKAMADYLMENGHDFLD